MQAAARPAAALAAEAVAAPAPADASTEMANTSVPSLDGVVDADAATVHDPAFVTDYVNQIYGYYKECEVSPRVDISCV